jgi:hypothetical protein
MKSYGHIYGQLGQTADRFSAELDHLLNLGLVCDTDFGFEQAAQHHGSLIPEEDKGHFQTLR